MRLLYEAIHGSVDGVLLESTAVIIKKTDSGFPLSAGVLRHPVRLHSDLMLVGVAVGEGRSAQVEVQDRRTRTGRYVPFGDTVSFPR